MRLAFLVAVRFKQLQDLAAFGVLQAEEHARRCCRGQTEESRTTEYYSPYKSITPLVLSGNQRLMEPNAS